MIVVDASAAVDLFVRNERRAAWVAERLASGGSAQVPALFDLEVLQALRRADATAALTPPHLADALANLFDIRAIRHPHEALLPRIWALRQNLTAYDAAYVALAEALDAPLLTTDARLARSSGHQAMIEAPPV